MSNFAIILLMLVPLASLKLSIPTVLFLFVVSFFFNKVYSSKPMHFLFYIFFIFFFVLVILKSYNFSLMFLLLSVVYATIFIVFFIFFVSFEDVKKTREIVKSPSLLSVIFLSLFTITVSNFNTFLDLQASACLPANYTDFYSLSNYYSTNEFFNAYNALYLEHNFTLFFFFFTLLVICFSISLLLSTSFKVKSYKWVNLLNFDNLKKKINIFIKNLKSRNSAYVFFFDRSGLYYAY